MPEVVSPKTIFFFFSLRLKSSMQVWKSHKEQRIFEVTPPTYCTKNTKGKEEFLHERHKTE